MKVNLIYITNFTHNKEHNISTFWHFQFLKSLKTCFLKSTSSLGCSPKPISQLFFFCSQLLPKQLCFKSQISHLGRVLNTHHLLHCLTVLLLHWRSRRNIGGSIISHTRQGYRPWTASCCPYTRCWHGSTPRLGSIRQKRCRTRRLRFSSELNHNVLSRQHYIHSSQWWANFKSNQRLRSQVILYPHIKVFWQQVLQKNPTSLIYTHI